MQLYAKDIMTDLMVTIDEKLSCEEAARVLVSQRISGAPVANAQGDIIGILSLSDIMRSAEYQQNIVLWQDDIEEILNEEELIGQNISTGLVSEFMSEPVVSVKEDAIIEEVAAVLYQQHIHRLLVHHSKTNDYVGILSTFDVLKVFSQPFAKETSSLSNAV